MKFFSSFLAKLSLVSWLNASLSVLFGMISPPNYWFSLNISSALITISFLPVPPAMIDSNTAVLCASICSPSHAGTTSDMVYISNCGEVHRMKYSG